MSQKKIVATTKAPKAIGPYSLAVRYGEFVFVSGQIPLDSVSGDIKGSNISEQTEQTLENLSQVLKMAGRSLKNVVKITVYLTDLNDFEEMNRVYQKFFPSNPPARSTVEVSRLPKDAKIEIDAVATNWGWKFKKCY